MATNIYKLREFIKRYAGLLYSTEPKNQQIKEARRRFFVVEYSKKFGIPNDGEIAREAVYFLIRSKKIKNMGELKGNIEKLPYLKSEVIDMRVFESEFKGQDALFDKEDWTKLSEREFIENIKMSVIEEARKEILELKESELKKIEEKKTNLEIQEKEFAEFKKEFESLKLNSSDQELLESFDDTQSKETEGIWWEKLGFAVNPFPGDNRGLNKILELKFRGNISSEEEIDFFEKLLVKTSIFDEFDSLLRNYNSEFLDNFFVLIGEYGSGKSVIFEFLSRKTILNNIYPITIWVDPIQDTDKLLITIYETLLKSKAIRDKYKELFNSDVRNHFENYKKEQICAVLKEIKDAASYEGFLIILDGLHKNPELSKVAIRVIGNLQNLMEQLHDEGVNATFLIAGSPQWIHLVRDDKSISGTLSKSKILELPEVSAKLAREMFNRRFQLLSKDSINPSCKITNEQAQLLEQRLHARLTSKLSFRDYIDEILPALKSENLDFLQISPIYQKDILEKLFNALKDNHGEFFRRLLEIKEYFKKRPENALKLLKILLGVGRFLPKESSFFNEHRPWLAHLLKLGLLKEANIDNCLGLVHSYMVQNCNSAIKKEYGVELKVIILELFEKYIMEHVGEKKSDESPIVTRDIERILISDFARKDKIADLLTKSCEIYKQICPNDQTLSINLSHQEFLDKTKESVGNFIKSALIILGYDTKNITAFDDLNKTILSQKFNWLFKRIQIYENYSNKLYHLKVTPEVDLTQADYLDLLSYYKRTFSALVDLINKLIRSCNIILLNCDYLNVSDIEKFTEMQIAHANGKYKDCAAILADYFEEKMRLNLFTILLIKYGTKYKSKIGRTINDYIKSLENKKTTDLVRRVPLDNCLYDCDRWHYGLVILDEHRHGTGLTSNKEIGKDVPEITNNATQNWKQVFSYIFESISRDLLDEWLCLIEQIAISRHHNHPDKFWEQNSNRLSLAIRYLYEIIVDLNKSYCLIFKKENIYVKKEESLELVYFSFMGTNTNGQTYIADEPHLSPVVIKPELSRSIAAKIEKTLKDEKVLRIDFENTARFEDELNYTFLDLITTIAYAIRRGKIVLFIMNGEYYIKLIDK